MDGLQRFALPFGHVAGGEYGIFDSAGGKLKMVGEGAKFDVGLVAKVMLPNAKPINIFEMGKGDGVDGSLMLMGAWLPSLLPSDDDKVVVGKQLV